MICSNVYKIFKNYGFLSQCLEILCYCDKVLRNLISFWTEQGRRNFSLPGEHLDFRRHWIQSDTTKAEKLNSKGYNHLYSTFNHILLTENKNIVNLWLIYFNVIKYIYIHHRLSLYVCVSILYISVCDNKMYVHCARFV